ncbi:MULTISPECIES: cell division ATP-binding protein FtsE [Allobacillus]|uniref:Cell division ATP-binding protein FtsE n=1 Tax=Allobacillus halotolerans TaxID=570278 RepID=A0ABS6GQQ7_9BACI|nr:MULTISPECIES: cell division ATP-binding protein FtsE [Allobacillus]MBU6081451.1 cell division ATP-binding protein FtsE [Allobacillus halotolerans]TSJ63713.1 cell division ATP-binding protein FtsE [Allobacillus sp. SKP2-8]
MIEMKNVYKEYSHGVMAVDGLTVNIDAGEFVYIVGASGAGKSSFIKMMYREELATKGEVLIEGKNVTDMKLKDVPFLRRDIGVIFQDFKLLPRLTAFENVAFALEVIEENPKKINKRVLEVLEMVGLKQKARFLPNQLSGGEQQRVAIARAIVNNPKIVIADEPTGNLDPETSWEIMRIFEEINTRGTTIVMATHSQEIVNKLRKRVIAMENGQIVRDEHRGEYGYEA